MDRTLKGVIHVTCNNLPQMEIEDQGGFEEVVLRNQLWLNQSIIWYYIKIKLLDEIKRLYYDEKMSTKASSRYSWNPSKNGD
jgi:hypothetical protein